MLLLVRVFIITTERKLEQSFCFVLVKYESVGCSKRHREVILALKRWRPEGQEFKVILCDVSSRLSWARMALVVWPILLGEKINSSQASHVRARQFFWIHLNVLQD